MTNIMPAEILRLWGTVEDFMTKRWNVGRGAKCRQTPIDVLFMTFTVLKNCGQWDTVASIFHIKAPTFEKMVMSYLGILSPHLYALFVEEAGRARPIRRIATSGHTFASFPAARYAVGVTFQQSNMPGGSQANRANNYSAKHKLHGYKVEVSVLPTGLAINYTSHFVGGVADITIFRENQDFHEMAMTKRANEDVMPDADPLVEEYPEAWAILADKGYQGLDQTRRVIYPTRRRPTDPLSFDQEATNRSISSDRTVVDNHLGRLCSLWAVCSVKFRWKEASYDMFFRACVALTNLHTRAHPLRPDDGAKYSAHLRRLHGIGNERRAKRLKSNQESRARRELKVQSSVSSNRNEGSIYDISLEH